MSSPDDAAAAGIHDWPSFHEFYVDFGTFVVVSFDPVASVAALKDDQATALAAQLPRNKYLAIVRGASDDSRTWPLPPREPPLALMFFLVGQRPPPPPQSSAYVALFSPHEHPAGRSFVIPQPPIPWPEVYVYTIDKPSARITRIHTSNPLPSQLTEDQLLQLLKAGTADMAALSLAQEHQDINATSGNGLTRNDDGAISASSAAPVPVSVSAEDHHALEDRQDEKRAKDNIDIIFGTKSSSSTSADSSSDSSSSKESDGVGVEPQTMRLHAEVWLDVTAVKDFGDPSEFPAFMSRLHEIEDEWRAREIKEMLADQPRTRDWAQGVADAGASAPEESESSAIERVPSPPHDAPAEVGLSDAAPATDHAEAPASSSMRDKKIHSLFKWLSRVVEVPRRFIAKLTARLPLRRKSKTNPPSDPSPPAP